MCERTANLCNMLLSAVCQIGVEETRLLVDPFVRSVEKCDNSKMSWFQKFCHELLSSLDILLHTKDQELRAAEEQIVLLRMQLDEFRINLRKSTSAESSAANDGSDQP